MKHNSASISGPFYLWQRHNKSHNTIGIDRDVTGAVYPHYRGMIAVTRRIPKVSGSTLRVPWTRPSIESLIKSKGPFQVFDAFILVVESKLYSYRKTYLMSSTSFDFCSRDRLIILLLKLCHFIIFPLSYKVVDGWLWIDETIEVVMYASTTDCNRLFLVCPREGNYVFIV